MNFLEHGFSLRAAGVASALLLVGLVPFLARPFHIDEPLFLWTAQQIQESPTDFYGFDANWAGALEPIHESAENPPLASYAIAAIAVLVGWGETALHAGFLPVALAALLGTGVLARSLCRRPLLAVLVCVWAPAFVLAGSMLMSDMLALAFWLWALVLWRRGLEGDCLPVLLVAAGLAGAAALTKYFALSLLPLMILYACLRKRRIGEWLLALALPLAMIAAYHFHTEARYGHSLVFSAAEFATRFAVSDPLELVLKGLRGLAFAGGCAATLGFLGPALLTGRAFAAWALPALGACLLVLVFGASLGSGEVGFALNRLVLAQFVVWIVVGLAVLVLAVSELRSARDPDAWLLVAWVLGTLVFVSFVNWTPNGRSVLPLLPAVGILAARRMDRRLAAGARVSDGWVWGGLLAGLCLSLSVQWADLRHAQAARTAARELIGEDPEVRRYFQGHWGFQYYAELRGGVALDHASASLRPGDRVVVPSNSSYVAALPDAFVTLEGEHDFAVPRWVSAMNPAAGSAFYAGTRGLLPFALGGAEPDRYRVFRVKRRFRMQQAPAPEPGG